MQTHTARHLSLPSVEQTDVTNRRPIAEIFRRTAYRAVVICQRLRISADAVSYASLATALGAALAFFGARWQPALLLLAVALIGVRLWLNMLDGMVAVATGSASRHGAIVNELPDRFSDVLIFTGVAMSGLCQPPTAYAATLGALLVAYVGILAPAVGAPRSFAGSMAKPLRMAALGAGSLLTWALATLSIDVAWQGFSVLDATLLIIIVGCAETLVSRLRKTFLFLSADAASHSSCSRREKTPARWAEAMEIGPLPRSRRRFLVGGSARGARNAARPTVWVCAPCSTSDEEPVTSVVMSTSSGPFDCVVETEA